MLFLLQILSALLVLRACVCQEEMLRILGGKQVLAGKKADSKFSWVVRLVLHEGELCRDGAGGRSSYTFICSGSLISQSWVLTAAHCSVATHVQLTQSPTRGGDNQEADKKAMIFRKILQINKHPGYVYEDSAGDQSYGKHSGRGRLENDIALFKTEEIKMKNYGKMDGEDFRGLFGREVYFLGYGLTKYLDNYEKQEEIDKELSSGPLQYGTGLLGDCATAKYQGTLMKRELHFNFCVMRKCSDFALTNNGDTGGPIVVENKIVGISTVMIEDRETEPSQDLMSVVATPVSPYIDWIQNLAKQSSTEFFK